MNILGVRMDAVSRKNALLQAKNFLSEAGSHMVFTPNPEMLVDASKDPYFLSILNASSLNICDGKGIQLVSGGRLERIAGVDFFLDLCELAARQNKTVFLLGSGNREVIEKSAKKLKARFPELQIVGVHPGPPLDASGKVMNQEIQDAALEQIILSAPHMLFVGFGHGKQEKWIYEFLPELPSVQIAMGVGGTFDFISGSVRRAPQWFRILGLEWLWRLLLQPRRIKRILKATVVFLFLFFRKK